MLARKKERCTRALTRLEAQLKSGIKTKKIGTDPLPLTDKDKTRIVSECEKLKKY